mmetsp:Transcript_14258/g.42225  ORF Transcript_14258/g.42225 Transcript_14258/m.42225 type:complete len:300 (+) Transcript_14258:650-1549(+)
MDRSVLMECTLGMAPCADPNLKATAMFIDGADSHFNRNVVACTHIGMVNNDGDNMYHQNHIWTNCKPPQLDNGTGDNNQLGFLVSGGTPQFDGGAIDNCHMVVTSYAGLIVTNTHFNGAARLILAPPPSPPQAITQPDRCMYWHGAMCSLLVTANTFTCGGPQTANHGPSSCGTIDVQYTPPQADQIQVHSNVWQNSSGAVCSRKEVCLGADCGTLFGKCTSGLVGPSVAARSWNAEALCLASGISLRALQQLSESDQYAALLETAMTPLQRAKVLTALQPTDELNSKHTPFISTVAQD